MKKIFYTLIATTALYACSGNQSSESVDAVIDEGDLTKMKQKQAQVLASYDSVAKVLTKLETAISEKDTTRQRPLVTSFIARDTTFNSYISIQGNVETAENILIYPEYQGVLTRLHVKQGQRVNRGQLLATIDDGGLGSQLSQLEAQYELAKTTFDRQQRLWNENIGSEIEFLEAKTNKEAIENNVKQLRSQLGKTMVRAPFSGVIDDIITEQGEVVAPGGNAIMRLVNLDNMYIEASVPESYLESVHKGTKVAIRFPAIGHSTEGTVRGTGSYIDPGNRTFLTEIDVPNPERKIKPNLMATLQLNSYSNDNTIIVPTGAIQENAQGEKFVFVLGEADNNGNGENYTAKVIRTKIETGHKSDGFVEALSGLNKEDTIVWEGALTLKDGITVEVKAK